TGPPSTTGPRRTGRAPRPPGADAYVDVLPLGPFRSRLCVCDRGLPRLARGGAPTAGPGRARRLLPRAHRCPLPGRRHRGRAHGRSARTGDGEVSRTPAAPVIHLFTLRERVDAHRDGEQQRGVLAGGDLDPVGLADAEPSLRDPSDGVAVALDLVLVVDEVPLRAHVAAVLDVDREPVADADERLLHRRHGVAVALDRHLVPDAELPLLDLRDLVAGGVLEDEGLAHAKRLAVDLEYVAALIV